eukprot:TRINITY_DN29459_c0_g1_i3.p4 TRINITY_DN29459_c0_g1~~TRINITY_DN29459_c0_g1_i3.p4  ORF type:complete len:100 (-),score=18.91 TRINITY_DN29459_c0_g1_i3:340-639(-)
MFGKVKRIVVSGCEMATNFARKSKVAVLGALGGAGLLIGANAKADYEILTKDAEGKIIADTSAIAGSVADAAVASINTWGVVFVVILIIGIVVMIMKKK